jgi:2-iminobutanoate/2-iminopropanoate deaminase
MEIEPISSPGSPQPIGPYSHAVRAGGFIFCSGMAGFDPQTGRIVEGGIRAQTAQVLRNLSVVLAEAGCDLSRVVKVTVFLHDWKYFKEMNETYAEFFSVNPPARSTAQGDRWPDGALVAIEAIALEKPNSPV